MSDQELATLTAKLESDPKNPDLCKEIGNRLFHLQRYEQAIEFYQKAIDIDPRFHKALYNLGNTYYKLDQFEKAVHYWHEAIEVKPDFDHAHFNLGYHYYHKGFLREAANELQKAAQINPKTPDTHHYLGLCFHQMNQLQKAIEEFRMAIQLAGDIPEPDYHYNLANTSYDLGDYTTAAAEWSVTLKLRPTDLKARNNYCDALLQLNRVDEALTEIEVVLKEDADYPPAVCTKAEILERLDKPEQARELYLKVIALTDKKENWELLSRYVKEKLVTPPPPQA
ncbi:MAG: tetratricopeptide repeat protein [Candidatus Ozemobacteraceae bacterium]